MSRRKRKKGKKRSTDHLTTRHHILPRSRGGGSEVHQNIVLLPAKQHQWWHNLFFNLSLEETHRYIDEVMVPGKYWTKKDLRDLREWIKKEKL